ncbi:hypothetical protein HML84_00070 [Alcanivorax sp. IO_7]|nr:hypothetical protein HML84_00070 [Alcanivorax sp. IO_7]
MLAGLLGFRFGASGHGRVLRSTIHSFFHTIHTFLDVCILLIFPWLDTNQRTEVSMRTGSVSFPFIVLFSLALAACGGDGEQQQQAGGPPEAGFVTVQPQSFTLVNELPGRTSPYQIAEVRPRSPASSRNACSKAASRWRPASRSTSSTTACIRPTWPAPGPIWPAPRRP